MDGFAGRMAEGVSGKPIDASNMRELTDVHVIALIAAGANCGTPPSNGNDPVPRRTSFFRGTFLRRQRMSPVVGPPAGFSRRPALAIMQWYHRAEAPMSVTATQTARPLAVSTVLKKDPATG